MMGSHEKVSLPACCGEQWGVGVVVRNGDGVEVVGSSIALRKYVNIWGEMPVKNLKTCRTGG